MNDYSTIERGSALWDENPIGRCLLFRLLVLLRGGDKRHAFREKTKKDGTGLPAPVFQHNGFGGARILTVIMVITLTVQANDYVGILHEYAIIRMCHVSERRALVLPLFKSP